VLNFSEPTYSGTEGNNVTVNVTRTGGTQGAVSANYIITGSAVNGATGDDYTAAPAQTVSFADGQTAAQISFNLKTDSLTEGTETALLQLLPPVGGATLGTLPAAILEFPTNQQYRQRRHQLPPAEFSTSASLLLTALKAALLRCKLPARAAAKAQYP
jgi:hypothetical protein